MKIHRSRTNESGWSISDLLIILAIVAFLAGMLLPVTHHPKAVAYRVNCVSHLKSIGTAFRMFAYDNDGHFPNEVSTNQNNVLDLASVEAFRQFKTASNELCSPKILICPADTRTPTTNFSTFNNSNLSYLVGLDVVSNRPGMLLTGDRNLTLNGNPVGSGLFTMPANQSLGWTAKIHKEQGNIGLVDGSVQRVTSKQLNEFVKVSRVATQRLSVP